MRTLILTCNTGEGHNSCAKALQETYRAHGVRCDITESLRFVSRNFSRVISRGHVFVYRHIPTAFQTGYEYSEKHPALFREKSGFYRLLAHGAGRLYQYIVDGGYDTVICVHVFPALIINEIRRRYDVGFRTAFVATDYTCSPSTEDSDMQYYFIPSAELIPEFTKGVITPQRIVPSGIPVRRMFDTATDKAIARREFGIDPAHRHLIVMCGSMGCGPIDEVCALTAQRLPADMEMSIVCGTNKKRFDELSEMYVDRKNVHVLGYVDNVSLLMDSADLYLTKPGGLSTTEAAAKRLPLVLINAVAGCETHNLNYFVSHGAAVTSEGPQELAELCVNLLGDGERLDKMSAAMGKIVPPHAAENIFQALNDAN